MTCPCAAETERGALGHAGNPVLGLPKAVVPCSFPLNVIYYRLNPA
jgi:hypothetical protein